MAYGTCSCKTRKYGLLGEKLGHSFSPLIHSRLCDYPYTLFEKRPEEVTDFIRNGDFDGLNVTIPYKKTVFKLCNALSPAAAQIGSVNTILRCQDGTIKGYNTDYYGFSYLVHSSGFDVSSGKILVLGSGGASVTVCAVLRDMGAADIVTISRSGPDNYTNLYKLHADAAYIVNTTPVGMYPNNGDSPIDVSLLPQCRGIIDLIYNPCKTKLLLDAGQYGIPAYNGLPMLVAQAKQAAELFTDQPIKDSCIQDITREIESATKNIILIGMPGCGKSTVGARLAAEIHRPFIDIDEVIESRIQMSICEFFNKYGEPEFRKIESQILSECAKLSGQVIATGGGIVTVPPNLYLMKQNSTVVMLSRPIEELPVAGRPISMSCDLKRLEKERLPLYDKWKDYIVQSIQVEDTTQKIIQLLNITI